ncbi:hypothetical protein ACN47E_000621 [Coniothyrium glycines]
MDRTAVLKLTSWMLLGTMVTIVSARQIVRFMILRRMVCDDVFLLLATALAIGYFLTTYFLATQGLGRELLLGAVMPEELMKGYYASAIIYFPIVCLAKLSLLSLFYSILQKQRPHQRVMITFSVFVLLWSIASLFAFVFQCPLPKLWISTNPRCSNLRYFWFVYGVIDIVTEVIVFMMSINLVAPLHIHISRKLAIIACFVPRVFVLGIAATRIAALSQASLRDGDRLWLSTIFSQMHVCATICTACIPYLIPCLRKLEATSRKAHATSNWNNHRNSSVWFRRHAGRSRNVSVAATQQDFEYNSLTNLSPGMSIHSPDSPMVSPSRNAPLIRVSSRSGLCISIPIAQSHMSAVHPTPRTGSSGALSPTCSSPLSLLSQPFVPSRQAPTPPTKMYAQRPTSPGQLIKSPPTLGALLLFPPPKVDRPDSPARLNTTITTGIPHRPTPQSQPRKFSLAPQPSSPPATMTLQCSRLRPESVLDLTSPMGAAINNWFGPGSTVISPVSPR